MSFNNIVVVGLGYIGLPTAAMFASKNKQVIGVDIKQSTIDTINAGRIHIVEPELQSIVRNAVTRGYLRATDSLEQADAFLIAVPTPLIESGANDLLPTPDLSYIKAAAESISKVLKKGDLVILESTSPVGTTEQISKWLSNERPDLTFPHNHDNNSDIRIAYCPERVLPGRVVREIVQNDRLIGGMTDNCSEAAINLYKLFVKGKCVKTNPRTAEMAKLTENTFRDVNIALANELSMICDTLDINVWELVSLANRHPRVNILQPGPGVGGHCIAVDPWFIASSAPDQSKLIITSRHVNKEKTEWVIKKVLLAIDDLVKKNPKKIITDIKIACFGLAFKADIDDLRESPAMAIVKRLIQITKCKIQVVEPNIKDLPESLKGSDLLTINEMVKDTCDIALLLVDHKEFNLLGSQVEHSIVIDTRGILNYS